MDFISGSNIFKIQKNDANQSTDRPRPLPSSPTVVTIVAKAVNVSKLENNELVSLGKYGFALAGDVKLNYYQLLLYGSKNSVLVNIILTKDFKYNVHENNTVEFLDKEKWHLEFNSTKDAIDFNSHMAFVLWKFNGSKELFWIDLYYPSRNDRVATISSIVEITYVANTVQGKTIGSEVSNNIDDDRYLKVNVSADGWERSLLGVNNDTKRIVYIPSAEMGAWKILTDGRQCLCLSMTVKKVYEVEEPISTNSPINMNDKQLNDFSVHDSAVQLKENVVSDYPSVNTVTTPTKVFSIEKLYEEFEKFKIENVKTNERLAQLEELFKEKKAEKVDNSSDTELIKTMKTVYKSIVREFPADQMFSGRQIQTKIKDIFSNIIIYSNQTQSNND